jgi:hypothetical protein
LSQFRGQDLDGRLSAVGFFVGQVNPPHASPAQFPVNDPRAQPAADHGVDASLMFLVAQPDRTMGTSERLAIQHIVTGAGILY